MKPAIREILKASDPLALAEYLRGAMGLTLSDVHLRFIIEQAAQAGGSEQSPWSESTWRLWLMGKATQPYSAAPDSEAPPNEPAGVKQWERALTGSSDPVFRTPNFGFCRMGGVGQGREGCSNETWDQLFPAFEAIGDRLTEQFEARGGRGFLGKAPFASWLYARLLFLGLPGVHEENDLGGYWIHFVVKAGGDPTGVLFIDADSGSVEVVVQAGTSEAVEKISRLFLELLLEDVRRVSRGELEVRAVEAGGTNSYGWTGYYFLGEGNTSG